MQEILRSTTVGPLFPLLNICARTGKKKNGWEGGNVAGICIFEGYNPASIDL